MPTQTFDDGSTFSYDEDYSTTYATPATDYSRNFTPGAVTPGATSWLDVLKYGIGRAADYKTASLAAQNTPVVYARERTPVTPMGEGLGGSLFQGNWMLWAGIGLAGVALVASLMNQKG